VEREGLLVLLLKEDPKESFLLKDFFVPLPLLDDGFSERVELEAEREEDFLAGLSDEKGLLEAGLVDLFVLCLLIGT
jgi:hypothetical protein